VGVQGMNLIDALEQIKWIPSIRVTFIDVIQIIIITLALYYLTKNLYMTRAWILVKGLMIIGAVYLIIYLTDMVVLQTIMQGLFSTLMIAIIIMLQPELQRLVELIGKRKLVDIKSLILRKQEMQLWSSDRTIHEIANACEKMGAVKTGALIVIERDIPLTDCIDSGIQLESKVSSQLLINIFEKNTPLHDGAVIVRKDKIESATCYLPLSSNPDIDKNLGTRHRAALGISETTDCAVVVVSEETGAVSFCFDGTIKHNIGRSELIQLMREAMKKSDEVVVGAKKSNSPKWIKILAPIFGVIIWMTVTATMDPITTTTVSGVPVTTINTEVLDDMGQTYTITSGNTISVKVKGRRSLVDYITANDIIATADFSKMSIVYSVPIHVDTIPEYEDVEVTAVQSMMKLNLEELAQTTVRVEVNIVGDVNEDYVIVVNEMESNTITVTCPKSIAKTIDKAVVTVDASDRTTNFISTVSPVLYDRNGDVISDSNVSINQDSIVVFVDVYDVKEIPIKITLQKQDLSASEYYVLNNYVPEFNTIRIASDNDTLTALQELDVVVDPSEKNDTADSIVVNLREYIPEGCYLAKNQHDQMSVELDLIKYKKMQIKISASDVKISGYDTKSFIATISQMPSTIELYYNVNVVNPETITLATLQPIIKVQDAKQGKYDAVITLTEIDGVTITSDLNIQYTLNTKINR
jgi:diadenylate cyclase